MVQVEDRRLPISPYETQLLLGELGRLPTTRHRAAEQTAIELVQGLIAGSATALDDEGQRCMLRAVEGIRARGPLPGGLAKLRGLLVHALEPVV